MEYIIRKRKISDAKELAHAIAVVWNETYKGIIDQDFLDDLYKSESETETRIENNINKQPNYYILEVNNKIAGWVYFELDSEKYEDAAEIHSLYILKEYQKMGFGKLLYNYAVEEIKKHDIRKLIIGCLEGNKSNEFYTHMGGKYIKSSPFRDQYKENIYLFNI